MIKVHRFDCKHKHTFYVPLHLPMKLDEFIKLSKTLTCPVCQMGDLNLHGQEFTIEG